VRAASTGGSPTAAGSSSSSTCRDERVTATAIHEVTDLEQDPGASSPQGPPATAGRGHRRRRPAALRLDRLVAVAARPTPHHDRRLPLQDRVAARAAHAKAAVADHADGRAGGPSPNSPPGRRRTASREPVRRCADPRSWVTACTSPSATGTRPATPHGWPDPSPSSTPRWSPSASRRPRLARADERPPTRITVHRGALTRAPARRVCWTAVPRSISRTPG
jgi:hypothetical protein